MAKAKRTADHIHPLFINGLSGRLIYLPAKGARKREILLIQGLHTSHERAKGLAEYLNRYGAVTSPDLPGFGGMDAFYKIGEVPTLDNLADYLAAFIKLRYKNKRITIIAFSYGFTIITRMLQKYPEISQKVDLLISISGYVHKSDYIWKKSTIILLGGAAWLASYKPTAFIVKHLFINVPVIKSIYKVAEIVHPKLKHRSEKIDFEVELWKVNDLRTYMYVSSRSFTMTTLDKGVDLQVYHVSVDNDHYFDSVRVEQNMRQVYRDIDLIKAKLPSAHVPTIIDTAKEVAPFFPPKIRSLLRKKP